MIGRKRPAVGCLDAQPMLINDNPDAPQGLPEAFGRFAICDRALKVRQPNSPLARLAFADAVVASAVRPHIRGSLAGRLTSRPGR